MLGMHGYASMVMHISITLPPRLNISSCHVEYSEPDYKHANSNLYIPSTERKEKE